MACSGAQVEALTDVVSQARGGFLRGVARVENGLISLLDLQAVIPANTQFELDDVELAAA